MSNYSALFYLIIQQSCHQVQKPYTIFSTVDELLGPENNQLLHILK